MQGRRLKYPVTLTAAMLATLVTGACSMDRPSWSIVGDQRVELTTAHESVRVPTASLNESALAGIVAQYRSSGVSAAEVTVTYDPKSKTNTAMKAADEAARISGFLRRRGAVVDVSSDILPVINTGDRSEAIITYDAVSAHAPKDCMAMGGIDGTETHADEDYKYGCAVETQLSRQIANPKDLKGREGVPSGKADGRRLTNIVEGYRTGTPNKALDGESATE